VNTLRPDSLVEVILTSGKVAVYFKDKPEEKTLMAPGDKVLISTQQAPPSKTVNTDLNYMAWKSGKLVFEETPLDEVVRLLNKVYRTEVVLMQPDLGKCTITATFENQTADAVLHVIEETLPINITRKGKQIQISGTACSE
jgi:transmembrane sensor